MSLVEVNQAILAWFVFKISIQRTFTYILLLVTGETVFPCGQCEGIYLNRKMLNAHKRIAHKEHIKKYKCEECPKAFTSTKSLYYHKLVHSGERPYSCEECGAAFRQKAARDGHYKVRH